MKIMQKMAVAAVVVTLALAGCTNSFSGTAQDPAAVSTALAAQNSANNYAGAGGLNLPGIGGALAKAASQTLTLSFTGTDYIDAASIASAISFHNMTAPAVATDVLVQGTAIAYTVTEVRDNTAYLSLGDLTGASNTIEMFIDSTKLTGKNGALKLDLDNDRVQGETGDDDYYAYLSTGGAPVVGAQRDPRAGINFAVAGAFSITAPATTLNTWTITYDRQGGLDTDDYKSLFDSCIVIEKYVPASNTWSTVTASSTTYVTTSGLYTVNFPAASAGDNYRVKTVNAQSIKTQKAYFGFIQRRFMDATTTAVSPAAHVADPTELSTVNQDAAFAVSTMFDTNGLNGEIRIQLNVGTGSIIGDKGMDETSATTANLQVFDTSSNVFVPLQSITFRYVEGTPVAAQTGAKTEIILKLDPAHGSAGHNFSLYAGPGLKTLGDATPGTAAAHFGDSAAIGAKPYGFSVLSNDGSTL